MNKEEYENWFKYRINTNPCSFEGGIINECRKMDKADVYQWIVNDELKIIELREKVNQLKNDNAVMKAGLIKISDEELELYKRVFEEVRNYIKNYPYQDLIPIELLVVKNILDQVKGSDK